MRKIKIHEAKTHFSALIHDVEGGQSIIIARGDEPVAKLVPLDAVPSKRTLGYDLGLPYQIADDFDTYIPPEFDAE